jgi:hypothetical protein
VVGPCAIACRTAMLRVSFLAAVVKALGVKEVPALVVRGRLYGGGLSAGALDTALTEPQR